MEFEVLMEVNSEDVDINICEISTGRI